MSPLLFSVYVDGLLQRIKQKGIGCHIGRHFYGVSGYADDVKLLVPTLSGLRKVIRICEEYAADHNILFNGTKSKLIVFTPNGQNAENVNVFVNGDRVQQVDAAVYLGNLLSNNSNDAPIERGIANFNRQFNSFMAHFGRLKANVKAKLFYNYCSSLYGCTLWDFTGNKIHDLYRIWRKSVRRLWYIPWQTHCWILPLLTGHLPIEYMLHKRFVKFMYNAFNSDNSSVAFITRIATVNPMSSAGRNYRKIMYKYKCMQSDFTVRSINYMSNLINVHYSCQLTNTSLFSLF